MRGTTAALIVLLSLLCLSGLAFSLYSQPFSSSTFHQTPRWTQGALVSTGSSVTVSLHIALKQQRTKELEQLFWQVSDPQHEKYGKHLTLSQIADLIAPSQQDIEAVLKWVNSVPCGATAKLSKSRDWIKVQCPMDQASQLVGSPFAQFKHVRTGEIAYRTTQSLSVPSNVAALIEFIGGANTPIHEYHMRSPKWRPQVETGYVDTPSTVGGNGQVTVTFYPTCMNGSNNTDVSPNPPCYSTSNAIKSVTITVTSKLYTRAFVVPASAITCALSATTNAAMCSATVGDGSLQNYIPNTVQYMSTFNDTGATNSPLSAMSTPFYPKEFVTPEFLKKLYQIPASLTVVSQQSTSAVAEFLEQYYNPDDLTKFFNLMGLPNTPVAKLIGPNNATLGSITGGEAQLDIQYLMGVAVGGTTWFWSVAGRNPFNAEEPFIEWLYAIDNEPNAPLVHSISYGDTEDSLPQNYTDRMNVEFQKMGARGMTVLFSSGDDGVASYLARDNPLFCLKTHPEFPASSPFVTAVGATQLSMEWSPICETKIRGLSVGCSTPKERVCSAQTDGVITSGGGFSNYYGQPDYQKSFVNKYLTSGIPLPHPTQFNASGRGFPDLSAYGNNYIVVMGNNLQPTSGTSASTPVVAAMVQMWNDILIRQGRPPLGFLNPFLYNTATSHPEAFFDVVNGNNSCLVRGLPCCDIGFSATTGWDPITGLGTPRWDIIANLLLNPGNPFPYLSGANGANGVNGTNGLNGMNGANGEDGKSPATTPIVAIIISCVALVLSLAVLLRKNRSSGTEINSGGTYQSLK